MIRCMHEALLSVVIAPEQFKKKDVPIPASGGKDVFVLLGEVAATSPGAVSRLQRRQKRKRRPPLLEE
ncbi:hypothetical protein NSPZN2_120009 [Nitrospira defluvii]|uniref:Uncharacterized protein n=1 Tax=Nitrospira defluvii TaxID=330214 RepID=A0ABM8R7L6_9BACT|nr:hypothetical protein NSPZN2_120009 [Nitrospira defluvii]